MLKRQERLNLAKDLFYGGAVCAFRKSRLTSPPVETLHLIRQNDTRDLPSLQLHLKRIPLLLRRYGAEQTQSHFLIIRFR